MRFWDSQDPDLDNGASNKVEGGTDVTNRSALMVATGSPPLEPGRSGHMLGLSAARTNSTEC